MTDILTKLSWQSVLFGEQPSRVELAKVESAGALEKRRIRVHRNHAFEHVSSASTTYFAWYGLEVEYVLSDYDDSMSFGQLSDGDVDLEIIWVDASRYGDRLSADALEDWLVERVLSLRVVSDAPVLVIPILGHTDLVENLSIKIQSGRIPGVRCAPTRPIHDQLGARFTDDRAAKFSGTRLSDKCCLLLARELACRWVPSLWFPRFKAIAVDLDHTLYDGVLGEDGLGVTLTDGHRRLQSLMLELKDSGLFLAIVSRNELPDVQKLFDERADFPLRWDSFHTHCVSWGEKSEALKSIADRLNIGVDAILYIDDNPGELAAIHTHWPTLGLVHASADGYETARIIEYFPRLWSWGLDETDTLRGQDVVARQQRLELSAATSNPIEYLRSLNVELGFIDHPDHHYAGRIFELSQKTNQFNLNLRRMTEVEIDKCLQTSRVGMVISRLKDRLSDSGIIGLVVAEVDGDHLVIQELAISCRALGRRIEDVLIVYSIRCLLHQLGASRVSIAYRTGERNQPARDWLTQFSGHELNSQGAIDLTRQINDFNEDAFPVTLLKL